MTKFQTQCLGIFKESHFVDDCSQTLMNSLKIDGKKVQKKVD